MKKFAILASAALLAACAGEPTVQSGPDAEISHDGLYRVDNARFDMVFVDPDADWARYDQILPGGALFEFRAVKKTPRTTAARVASTQQEFYIDDKARARLEEEVGGIFDEELAKNQRFTYAETPGENVLIVRGALHDIVSRVPPQYVGRSEIYLRSVGEATLIIEIVDSMSGEVLARVIERRSAERPGGQMMWSNPVTTWTEVRRLARIWASRLNEGLEAIPTE